jgi:hypothetical protein
VDFVIFQGLYKVDLQFVSGYQFLEVWQLHFEHSKLSGFYADEPRRTTFDLD